jgi:hypothetical protein
MRNPALPIFALLTISLGPSPALGQEPEPQRIRPAAVLSEPFSRIRGIREVADGRVLVADQREKAVYLADFAAQTRSQIGRNGSGPAEYQAPTGLYPTRADSSYLVDISNMRVSVLAPDGRVIRSEPLFGADRAIPAAADTSGNLYWDDITDVRLAMRQNPRLDQAHVIRRSPDGTVDTLASLTIPGGANPTPFWAWDDWAASLDGRIVAARNGQPFRIDTYEKDGTHRPGPETPFQPIRVSRADRQAYATGNRSGGGIAGGASPEPQSARRPDEDFPDFFPPVRHGRMWVGADGNAWVQRHQHLEADGLVYDVFDPFGRRVARYRLPPETEVVGFGVSGMYAIRVDEVGLQWLQRFDVGAAR